MPAQHIKRSMDQRRALIAECRRRMEAGEEIKSICAALQIPRGTFYKWSKIHGFRRGDVDPDHPRARARDPVGPSKNTSSGLYMRGGSLPRPDGAGRKRVLSPEAEAHFLAHPADAYIVAKRAHAMGDHSLVKAITKLLRQVKSQESDLLRLRSVAQSDPNYDWRSFQAECMARWDDEECLARAVFAIMYHDGRRYPRPPESKRPAQAWIDHFVERGGWSSEEIKRLSKLETSPPSFEPFSGCHASVNMAANPMGAIPLSLT